MTDIYGFDDYRKFVQKSFVQKPKRGRGEYRRLAEQLRISSVAVSQIFRGDRDLSLEQALETAKFLLLDADEKAFFILLVEVSRAGTKDLRQFFKDQIDDIRKKRDTLAKRMKEKIVLDEATKARFYSNWFYSAVRMASSVPELNDFTRIAARLNLQPAQVAEIGHFLIEQGLCVRDGAGIRMGPSSTMLAADSPFINNHRRNWRLKGLEHLQSLGPQDLFYSGVVSCSEADLKNLRELFMQMITDFMKNVQESPSETIACLNLDWFELKR